jgi:hypothetical protein
VNLCELACPLSKDSACGRQSAPHGGMPRPLSSFDVSADVTHRFQIIRYVLQACGAAEGMFAVYQVSKMLASTETIDEHDMFSMLMLRAAKQP